MMKHGIMTLGFCALLAGCGGAQGDGKTADGGGKGGAALADWDATDACARLDKAALGAALGEALESPSDEAAPRHWRNLPPLDATSPLPGGAVPLSRLVEAPAALSRALSQIGLLPRGMDGAALQAALKPGQSLVTEDGALWRWDGHTNRAGAPTPWDW